MIEANPQAAIAILSKRVAEINGLADLKDPDDPRIAIAERNLVSDIRDVFGVGSHEFQEHEHLHFWTGAFALDMTERERLRSVISGIRTAKAIVESLVARVEERRSLHSQSSSAAPTGSLDVTIGDWRIIRPLRRDGQGEVLLVEDRRVGRGL